MFVVSEVEAAAIRTAFEQGGELSAAVELRRLFPGITDTMEARACARTIAGWKPLATTLRQVRRVHQGRGPGGLNNPPPPSAPTLGREPALKRCSLQVGSVNANGSFEQHDPPHGALIMFASTGTWRDLAGVWMCGAAVLVLRVLR
jgi:hypothetical protein